MATMRKFEFIPDTLKLHTVKIVMFLLTQEDCTWFRLHQHSKRRISAQFLPAIFIEKHIVNTEMHTK
jgi:hypothetical protein